MALKPITVTQLNGYVSRLLGTDPLLGAVTVQGEISALTYHRTGHVYFSLSDGKSLVRCFLPKTYAQRQTFVMEEGDLVVVSGAVRVYEPGGTYSINVRTVDLAGAGAQAEAFVRLKSKLEKEGLFDPAHKKKLPAFPRKIGVVTSPTGAAVQDILKIIQSRNNLVDVVVYPVLVQGPDAAADISHRIAWIDRAVSNLDLLIVGRGGGSPEDLAAFNDEGLARAIYACSIPVISAVGHEIDFSISDFVADMRAETPTAAAQMAVPDVADLRRDLLRSKEELHRQLANRVMVAGLQADKWIQEMTHALQLKVTQLERSLETQRILLEENNPLSLLQRGYALISTTEEAEEQVITSAAGLQTGQTVSITFADGTGRASILEVQPSTRKESSDAYQENQRNL